MRQDVKFMEGIVRHDGVEIRADTLEFIPAD